MNFLLFFENWIQKSALGRIQEGDLVGADFAVGLIMFLQIWN